MPLAEFHYTPTLSHGHTLAKYLHQVTPKYAGLNMLHITPAADVGHKKRIVT